MIDNYDTGLLGLQGSLLARKQLMEPLRLHKNPTKRNNNISSDKYLSLSTDSKVFFKHHLVPGKIPFGRNSAA